MSSTLREKEKAMSSKTDNVNEQEIKQKLQVKRSEIKSKARKIERVFQEVENKLKNES